MNAGARPWPEPDVESGQELRLAELMAAMSLATDITMGQPMEDGLAVCLLATRVAPAAAVSATIGASWSPKGSHEVVAQEQGRIAEGLRPAGLGEQLLARADPLAEHAEPEGSPAVWRLLVVHAGNDTAPARSVSFSGRRG